MERLGFIGLGIMGKPMVRNLLKAGYAVTVFNRSQAAIDELAQAGANPATSLQQVAEQSDIVITCLPDSPDVEAVVQGLLKGLRSGMLFIDMSTIAAATSKKIYAELQARGIQALDAPVSGGDIGAQQGTLSIMVGGEASAFDRALPVLQAMGKNIVHVGDSGAGQITKACNQIVVAMTVQAVAEALTLAKKSGVDPAKVRDALLGGFAQSRVLEVHGKRILENSFQPGFKLDLHRKDMNIVLQTGRELGVPLLGSSQVTMLMDALIAQGKGGLDNAAISLLYDLLSTQN
ncbi:2-hydroxy-3-oxopropionate reductase [Leptolyngbya boryana NIES-2135]|jgi:2-hydroxy-3-oxopropionate reductase|uniref:2-hydroxy-3-oxopropionate reductase n=1 Tax=Leptolyngbya boryana NIES-2135 TaxID=1973484 RepID=A0A1Z4JQS1_LEPBY|nr:MULTISPECIES: 2-hydroxy-3-oxopropionate reductase [Leptolyngbya]BAY59082.1 2-hydroxy-3-oxopropionate reductase [Leptolyngbya boryana NIES-2135]MBD2368171.1 2-hydroxy-3-oxopropionate reductase [Leptolyngbya sp. FACHB-161]MBD2374792.1 2-hydroxy-3-oxopropionate reductase [Leptolyngbya sp. FACHB-238]MBD2399214.1 2-hydroxy-3-oxopropionate reductase [Leptolyngbya sp. FACHB-239]MBD2405219.1 2-hydroxy-3-oxopropionate reductase [Leptolyngbya sp. FACHB-402]